ncbi:MAG: ParB/RepB/Spo0J family partition protein [Acidobacteria bacterium]|nr:ParB/RepB/Spo0J family partition protein [Acidobacteriota bacterium]
MQPKKPALGRGLSALIPSSRPAEDRTSSGVRELDLDLLDANRRQPRRRFDDDAIQELASSIKESGILQPVLVTRDGDRYRILAGERRARAARLAGLTKIPVLVREGLSDRDHLLLALVENVQRKDLTPLEEAEAYRSLKEEFGLTQDEVAERVGKDRATVANAIRLLKLPPEVRRLVESGALTAGHARTLLPLPSAADQEALAQEIADKGLSVRATEARVNALLAGAPPTVREPERKDADTRDAELRLSRALGTFVEIKRKKKGGELRIRFHSEEVLIDLFNRLIEKEHAL